MSPALRYRSPNPHLGAFYAIIGSAFVSLSILLALLEQVGWTETALAPLLIAATLILYAAIAGATRTWQPDDFFASGRRVPAVFNGGVLAATLIGGVGFLSYTGLVFFLGADAFSIGLGWCFGLLAGTVLFSPYLRKAGAYTVPSFLGMRFHSGLLRVSAALFLLLPTAMLMAAEIKAASFVMALFLPIAAPLATLLATGLVAATAMLGGLRSLTWTGSAQILVGAIAFAVPMVIVAVLLTTLPLPQITYGERLPQLETAEIDAGIGPATPRRLATALPSPRPQPALKPFTQSFGALGRFDFLLLFFCVGLGSAALPSLLIRSGVTISIDEQRRAGAWAVLFVAVFAISAPAAAAFAKELMLSGLPAIRPEALPDWMRALAERHLLIAGDMNGSGALQAPELKVARDGVLFILPAAAHLPLVGSLILAAGAIAMALAGAGMHLYTLGVSLADDFYRLVARRFPAAAGPSLGPVFAAAAGIGLAAFGAAMFLSLAEIDIVQWSLTGLLLLAATYFPVLLLAIWWDGCTGYGALAAMGTGFGLMMLELLYRGVFGSGSFGSGSACMCLFAVAAGIGAGIGASLWQGRPTARQRDYFERLRDPDGEAIHDEAQQRSRKA